MPAYADLEVKGEEVENSKITKKKPQSFPLPGK